MSNLAILARVFPPLVGQNNAGSASWRHVSYLPVHIRRKALSHEESKAFRVSSTYKIFMHARLRLDISLGFSDFGFADSPIAAPRQRYFPLNGVCCYLKLGHLVNKLGDLMMILRSTTSAMVTMRTILVLMGIVIAMKGVAALELGHFSIL